MTAQPVFVPHPAPRNASPGAFRMARLAALAHIVRARARLTSALILLAFVLCHFTSHIFLLVSLSTAETVLGTLMAFWWTNTGAVVLAAAVSVHFLNALWSVYRRRYLRLSRWEWAQLGLGLAIPPLLMVHVIATRISDQFLGTTNSYLSVLVGHWILTPWLAYVQIAAVLIVWTHACIGLHFWLRTKHWYPDWLPVVRGIAVLLPALAIAGYVSAGNQVIRDASRSSFATDVLSDAHITPEHIARTHRVAFAGIGFYLALVALPFAARGVRAQFYRLRRPPQLTHTSGRTMTLLPGATVLETLRAYGVPHASVCGGRARCTTCRVRVVYGLEALPEPAGLEAAALARILAPPGLRLACQIRPTADISVMPLLAADAGASDGLVRGGMEGSERLITVVFIDLRGSTTLGETKLPYDVLFILNQFFSEMTKALTATGGHYSNFTGDGLMALYGLESATPEQGPAQALRGAREMLRRLDQLNAQIKIELRAPLRIGIGIHFGEAVVGAMGPPRSQIVTAIGDTVNTAARLESLTKDYDCPLIISRRAAEAAGLDLSGLALHSAAVKGRTEAVDFYALAEVPEPRT
jgi:adenylate cyclase